MNTEILFNTHKLKYNIMNSLFKEKIMNCKIYFCLDLDYFLEKFLSTQHEGKDICLLNENESIVLFIKEILNLIAHYKYYFYNHLDSNSFFFINIRRRETYKKYITKFYNIVSMIPRIYIYYSENKKQSFYLKYNLFRNVYISNNDRNKVYLFNMGYDEDFQIFYTITEKYVFLQYFEHKVVPYLYDHFIKLHNFDSQYLSKIRALMPVFMVLEASKQHNLEVVKSEIERFINFHRFEDFNKIEIQEEILRLFDAKLIKKLHTLTSNLYNSLYSHMMRTIMITWNGVIKDKSIRDINELLNIPHDKRIRIENLLNY